jgi:Acetyltransferase (GNAT) family
VRATDLTTRLLPPDEWHRLIGTELEPVVACLAVDAPAHVLVIERDGCIVGCWLLMATWHVEGLWVAPAHRKRGRVGQRLLDGMRTLVRKLGSRAVVTASLSSDVTTLLRKIGATELLGTHFLMRMD